MAHLRGLQALTAYLEESVHPHNPTCPPKSMGLLGLREEDRTRVAVQTLQKTNPGIPRIGKNSSSDSPSGMACAMPSRRLTAEEVFSWPKMQRLCPTSAGYDSARLRAELASADGIHPLVRQIKEEDEARRWAAAAAR